MLHSDPKMRSVVLPHIIEKNRKNVWAVMRKAWVLWLTVRETLLLALTFHSPSTAGSRVGRKRTVKGLDFKTLWDTEILLDFTADNSFDGKLSALFNRVKQAVFSTSDAMVNKIPVDVIIPTDNTDTTDVYGSYQGQYIITNAYKFLKCYLKY